ncbi:MAG: EAL domain-containing protein [Treponema sp.]|nr:EAL domain-containing protein [Treponema sp.]
MVYTLLYVPYLVYALLVLLNLKMGWFFRYDEVEGYVRGSLKYGTYITTAIYVCIAVGFVVHNRKNLSRRITFVFGMYPLIAMSISVIQFFFPHMVMTGTAVMAPMLMAYLAIQTDLLDYDLATGLMTEKYLARTLNREKKKTENPVNLIVVSIENYYTLYETIGYSESNYLLFKIAEKISSYFPKNSYHLSTDRFAVVGNNMDKMRENILKLTEQLKNFEPDQHKMYHVDIRSVGLTVPGNAKNYNNAMEMVSEMLSNAQKDRRKNENKFLLCDEVYEDKLKRTNAIKEILERELTVDSKMYQVYYQPIYSIGKEKYMYAEALSRLLDTEIGTIRPDEFIAVAESKGLIERLGNVAFEKICKFISENKETVKAVSVNFSVNQLTNPHIVENVLSVIKKYGISPQNIIMEITESIFIDDFESIKERMIKLADAGIIFYLDDFGTGYSNFANVVELPFTTIKIDRSMVLSMEGNEDSRRLIYSLISAFKKNGLNILMEGVENLTQDKLVREAGADYIQGFLYKRPISEKECLEVFKEAS